MEPMQFSVITKNKNTNEPRLGTLKHATTQIDTPTFMFYTKVNENCYFFNHK